jgi:hypothetical protein
MDIFTRWRHFRESKHICDLSSIVSLRRLPPSSGCRAHFARSLSLSALPDDFFKIRQIFSENPPESAKQNWWNPPEIGMILGRFSP